MNSLTTIGETAASDPFGSSPRILIVDDEPRMRSSLRLLLEKDGREILESANGIDAIAILQSLEVDLILLDIGLPDISGLEVMERIAIQKIPADVIIVSADDAINSAIIALRNGALDYVLKPYEPEDIRLKVENALRRRDLERSHALMSSRLAHSEQLHRFLVDQSPDLIYTLDGSGHFTFINSSIESLLGFSKAELIGSCYETIVHDEDLEKACYAFIERRRDNRATANLEVRLKRKNERSRDIRGHHIVAMLSAIGIYKDRNQDKSSLPPAFVGTYGVARDISERKIAEETIAFQALHDQLTNLPNQRLFKDRLEMAISHSKRHGGLVAVMFIDLDRFKIVNDTHGHGAGDELLKSVAHRLRSCMRTSDTLARKGGDEFTVLLPDLSHAEDSAIIAGKMLDQLKSPFLVAGQDLYVTASIGIAVSPRDGENIDSLLKNADIAMYRVKADGKNGFKFFFPDMNVCHSRRRSLENELRQAIPNSEFELYYHPQISMSSSRIVGMEALIRWNHPVHGLLYPGEFIDMAEDVGLIGAITDWVLEEACGQLSHWLAMGFKGLRMSINASPLDFEHSDIVERICSLVDRYQLPADSLEIEITENVFLRDTTSVINKMRSLRKLGIRISIDDFGICYSSLNYLRLFPISTVKIDQAFVRELSDEHRESPIIQAITDIARGFGFHLVAEGVESDCQMDILYGLGCEVMQGFLFGKPAPAVEVEYLLNNPLLGSQGGHMSLNNSYTL